MGQLTRSCPHCYTKNVSFTAFGEIQKPNTEVFTTSFYCGGCFGGYVAEVLCYGGPTALGYKGNIENESQYFQIEHEYPVLSKVNSPKYLPENLDKFFLQAANSLNEENLDASSIMSRKVLEVAVKKLAPEANGNLYQRIESLAEAGLITQELRDWAHIIRGDGNEAAHEEEPVSVEFATELLSFSEMFLMYTFTMPGMISSKRHDENIA